MPRFLVRNMVSSLLFNGSSNYVTVNDTANLKITGDLSLGGWIKISDYINYNGLINKYTDDNHCEYHVRLQQNTGEIYLQTGLGSSNTNYTSLGIVPAFDWHHWAITKDSSHVNFYIDAVLVRQLSVSATPVVTTTANVEFGQRNDGSMFFHGKMREMFIGSRAFTLSEIQSIYYNGQYPSTNLVSLWKCDEDTGTTIADSQSGYTGTLTNAPSWDSDAPIKSRTLVS